MDNAKKRLPKMLSKSYMLIFMIFVIISILGAAFGFQYYQSLYSTIREENQLYLQEITKQIGNNIERIIKDNYSTLNTMAVGINNSDSLSDIRKLLQKQKNYWNYKDLLLVDSNGKVYDTNNNEIFLTLDEGMRERIIKKEPALSTTQTLNNDDFIFFSVPLDSKRIDNKDIIALVASYSPSSFDSALSMESFSEKSYSQIVRKIGTVVTQSNSSYAIDGGYNIFSTIAKAQIDSGYSMSNVINEIENDKIGMLAFNLNGAHTYMVYTPILTVPDWHLLTFVPVEVVNQKSDTLLKSTLLFCGLIAVVFAGLIATLAGLFTSHRRKLENIAYVDVVTGGHTADRFYEISRNLIDSNLQIHYAIVYSNMEKFKVLNEQYGKENCNLILQLFHDQVRNDLSENECIGRITADNFCLLLEFVDEQAFISRFTKWQVAADKYVSDNHILWSTPLLEFGIYVIDNNTLSFPQMIDRAKIPLNESSRAINNKLRYAFYDDKIRSKMMREKELEDKMQSSLESGEFKLYLQPKYKLPEEIVGGAEALIRWESRDEGMIYPNEFIPLFEKNGFVVNVDLWIFEEVCKNMKRWIQEGQPLVKISVNCSRIQFKDPKFLQRYIEISNRYNIDRKYLEIELTESVVFENTALLTQIIESIRDAGFGCSMDDFGSGYSSLNMIQSIPVDVLKLDRIFFKALDGNTKRSKSVVKSVVELAKSLSMETVAEGVEYREQVDMLKELGCDYVQGYVFAKPMKVSDFDELLKKERNK